MTATFAHHHPTTQRHDDDAIPACTLLIGTGHWSRPLSVHSAPPSTTTDPMTVLSAQIRSTSTVLLNVSPAAVASAVAVAPAAGGAELLLMMVVPCRVEI